MTSLSNFGIAIALPAGKFVGCEGKIDIDCRVWIYQAQEYTVAPVPMIVDAILSAVYGGHAAKPSTAPKESKAVPENLKRFFAGKAAKQQSDCCGSSEQDVAAHSPVNLRQFSCEGR